MSRSDPPAPFASVDWLQQQLTYLPQWVEATTGEQWLRELIAQISMFPTPWGIRVGLAVRGIDTGPLPLPSSSRRIAQVAAFHAWLPPWLDRLGEALGRPIAGR